VRALHWTGDRVLALMEEASSLPIAIASLGPGEEAWTAGSASPVIGGASQSIWAGDRLWVLSRLRSSAGVVRNAGYDPITDTWAPLDRACPLDGSAAAWTGDLILEPRYGRRAFDPRTGDCLSVPRSGSVAREWFARGREWFATAWTGEELILWSGSRGAGGPPQPDGVVFRPRAD
jgi:hypothetical protein